MSKELRTEPIRNKSGSIWEKIYEITCYPKSDNCQFDTVLTMIQGLYFNSCKVLWIKHDKDVLETGELEKDHYHILLIFPNKVTLPSLAKKLNIPERQIEWKADETLSIQYLVHWNEPVNSRKFHYSLKKLKANFNYTLYFGYQDETSQVRLILEQMKLLGKFNRRQLLEFCLENDLYGAYRRGYSILKEYFDDDYKPPIN